MHACRAIRQKKEDEIRAIMEVKAQAQAFAVSVECLRLGSGENPPAAETGPITGPA